MPTYGRAEMLPAALHGFLDQDYAGPATLYILDDSPVAWQPCCTERTWVLRGVHYFWDNLGKRTCAAKRNHLMRIALEDNGPDSLFALWDDDDLHGPARLRHQVEALLAHPEAEVCILSSWLLYEPRRHLAACARGLDTDGTAVFTKAHWDRAPWDESIEPIAAAYSGPERLSVQLRQAPASIVRVDEPDDYVVVRHGANNTGEPSASYRGGVWKHPDPGLSADDLSSRLRTAGACRSPRS